MLAAPLVLTGCGGDSSKASAPSYSASATDSPQASSAAAESTTAPSTATSTPRPVRTTSATPSPSISIPPNLCAATDIAQNTADAYLGALSAGNEKEALDCVLPHSVPLATTESLLAKVKNTAVYLPKQGGADGPTNFDYVGNGKTITVTVTRQADHKTWVTKVAVR